MLILLLIAAPLAYATVHDISILVFCILCTLTFLLTFIKSKISPAQWIKNHFVVLGLAVIVIALFQLISGKTVYAWATALDLFKMISYGFIFLTILTKLSLEKGQESTPENRRSLQNILRLGCLSGCLSILFHSIYDFNSHIAANALYFTVLLALASGPGSRGEDYNRRFFKHIIDAIIWIGLGVAVFAIMQKFSFNGHIYWVGIKAPHPVGPYYNYDHFAGFMELCTPLAIASAIAQISHSTFSNQKGWVNKVLWFSSPEANRTLRTIFFAMIMAATVFMSTSRGGIMSFCITQVIFLSIVACKASGRREGRKMVLMIVSLVMLIGIFVLWLGPKEFLDRFRLTSIEKIVKMEGPDAYRLIFYRDTLPLIKDHWVLGSGLGTFGSAFSQYRTFSYTLDFLRYTHNDYLQFMAEMGALAGGIILFVYLILFMREYLRCVKRLE